MFISVVFLITGAVFISRRIIYKTLHMQNKKK